MIDDCGPDIEGGWVLPAHAHVPGTMTSPDKVAIATAIGDVPDRTEPAAWLSNRAYRYGFVLYRNGFYWEAHEVWEAVWLGCRPNSPERHLVQALIQLSNAALKDRMANGRAVHRLLVDAQRLLGEAIGGTASSGSSGSRAVLMGVDLKRLNSLIDEQISAI